MRHVALVALLATLILCPSTFADEGAKGATAAKRAQLTRERSAYEVMLRDAKTETAAKYFVERIEGIEGQLRQLEKSIAARTSKGTPPPAPLAVRGTDWLRAHIRKKTAEKSIGLSDVTAWTRRELPEAFFVDNATWAGMAKPVRPEVARKLWEERKRGGWHAASFGSGTFIVRPPGPKPRRRIPSAQGRPAGKDAADHHVKLPTPLTRDQWWRRASVRDRTDWVLAFFVQQSGLFDVHDEEATARCRMCNGSGQESKMLSSGDRISYLCTRCAGVRHDVTVRYR